MAQFDHVAPSGQRHLSAGESPVRVGLVAPTRALHKVNGGGAFAGTLELPAPPATESGPLNLASELAGRLGRLHALEGGNYFPPRSA